MVLVDSSAWIDFLRGKNTQSVGVMRAARSEDEFCIGDLILLEVLQGARDEADALRIGAVLSEVTMLNLLDTMIATAAAANFRRLRALGITIRKTADLIIGTYCIENDLQLLHSDRDFDPMARHLGLRVR